MKSFNFLFLKDEKISKGGKCSSIINQTTFEWYWLILMNSAVNVYIVNIFNDIFLPPFLVRNLDLYAVLEVLKAAYVYIPTELKHWI